MKKAFLLLMISMAPAVCRAIDFGLGRASAHTAVDAIKKVPAPTTTQQNNDPQNPSDPQDPGTPTSDDPPVFENLSISIDNFDAQTNCAGDISFPVIDQWTDKNIVRRPFFDHGRQVPDPQGNLKALPGFNYNSLCALQTPVYSPVNGVVNQIFDQGTAQDPDYEILIIPRAGSKWFVSIDHIRDLTVAQGDTVVAGQRIASSGAFELDVGHYATQTESGYHDCLWNYFDPALKATYQAKIRQMMLDWEGYFGSSTEYDESKYGCLTNKIYE